MPQVRAQKRVPTWGARCSCTHGWDPCADLACRSSAYCRLLSIPFFGCRSFVEEAMHCKTNKAVPGASRPSSYMAHSLFSREDFRSAPHRASEEENPAYTLANSQIQGPANPTKPVRSLFLRFECRAPQLGQAPGKARPSGCQLFLTPTPSPRAPIPRCRASSS